MAKDLRDIVVVLGAGRSGTSLTMNLAAKLGVAVSDELVGPSANNKRGAYEDINILTASRSLLRYFNRDGSALSYLPMPEGWLESDRVKQAEESLAAIVTKETMRRRLWGFKEPVTAKLLPMWKRIFSNCDVRPIYLLSLRHPAGVASSFQKAYGTPVEISTLIWLSRYVDAIRYTDADFAVFDYDDWFSDPCANIDRLSKYLELPLSSPEVVAGEIHAEIRTTTTKCEVNSEALDLYEALYKYKDGLCDKAVLIDVSARAGELLKKYSFFDFSADTLGKRCADLSDKLSEARRTVARQKRDATNSESLRLEYEQLKLKDSDPVRYILKKRTIPNHGGARVVVGVASFKAREKVFKASIASLYDQVDHIYVYLNGYDHTPDFLKQEKFTVFHGLDYINLSANGKVFSLGEVGSCYFFTVDDDILYPHDYVSRMTGCLKKYSNQVAVCVHGSVLPARPEWYYERYTLHPFQGELASDKFVNLIGSGTFAFHTDVLKADFTDFLPHVMVDLRFSILAKQQGIPLVSIARKKFWLKALIQGEGLYQEFLFKKTIHTEKVIEHAPWDFDTYSSIVKKRLGSQLLCLSDSEILDNNFDFNFISSMKTGTPPTEWSETSLYHKKIEERDFVRNPIAMYRLALRQKERSQKDLLNIKNGKVYRITRATALATKQPLWNLFLLPYRVLRILFS